MLLNGIHHHRASFHAVVDVAALVWILHDVKDLSAQARKFPSF